MNVFKRITNVFNAITGRTEKCGGNCSCHSEGVEGISTGRTGPMGTSVIDISGMQPEIQEMFRELALPEKQLELESELAQAKMENGDGCECGNDGGQPMACVHLDYIPVCHAREGDMKPDRCASSTCPVRMYQVALDELQKKAAMIAYG